MDHKVQWKVENTGIGNRLNVGGEGGDVENLSKILQIENLGLTGNAIVGKYNWLCLDALEFKRNLGNLSVNLKEIYIMTSSGWNCWEGGRERERAC